MDILRFTAVQDAGKAIHPSYVEEQMQGGCVQGIGWALNEEYYMSESGQMMNSSLLDYRMPISLDLPMIDTVIVEVPNPGHPFGARGVHSTPSRHFSQRHIQGRRRSVRQAAHEPGRNHGHHLGAKVNLFPKSTELRGRSQPHLSGLKSVARLCQPGALKQPSSVENLLNGRVQTPTCRGWRPDLSGDLSGPYTH